MRIGIFDLGSVFWTLAGARMKEESASGLALQVLRYMRDRAEKSGLDVVTFASDGPPELPSRSWRLRVDPSYKGHRAPKDEPQRAELVALVSALETAGFPVIASPEGKRWPDNGHGPSGPDETVWFEADDIAYSLAMKVAGSSTEAQSFEPWVFSNDWDLAQVLALPFKRETGVGEVSLVRFFTTRGEERTSADVEREFGIPPAKLAELKALAGDPTDGYKPFPGEAPGKPGIGEKGAADLLWAFGSASSAMAAALSNLDATFAEKGIPKRIPALLRKGGEEALTRGLKLATLRGDAPVPDGFDVGDWEEAEALLLAQKVDHPAPIPDRVQLDGASEGRIAGPATNPGIAAAPYETTTEKLNEIREARDAPEAIEEQAEPVDLVSRTAKKILDGIKTERASDRVLADLERKTELVILTEAEFMAIAPLPAMWAAGLLPLPADVAEPIEALVHAIGRGQIRPTSKRQAFVGTVSEAAAQGLSLLAGVATSEDAAAIRLRNTIPHFALLAAYTRPLVRST